jgi:nicotinate-nucleotide pyrophosphorylase (carboxylating)
LNLSHLDLELLEDFFRMALREDLGSGDITSRATVPEGLRASAVFVPKEDIVVAGLSVVQRVLGIVDPALECRPFVSDGAPVKAGSVLAEIQGAARSILAAERLTLNLLQRMSGIASETRRYVEKVQGTSARVLDTRKTAPGLRILDKYAVACGGGMNHRTGLFDGVLIKNNHIAFHASVAAAVCAARQNLGHLVKIEVEVPSPENVTDAIEAGADLVLLDNFTPAQTRRAVEICARRVPLESSGGITLGNIREFAEAGVDYISVGALTHSARAADIHLRVAPDHGSKA